MSSPTAGKRLWLRSHWTTPLLLALLLHVGVLAGLDHVPWLEPDRVQASAPEPIQLVFASEADPASDDEQPTRFTELPEDRSDVPPEKADLLSNVDSRARDRAPDGDSRLPQMKGEGESPEVALQPLQARVSPLPQASLPVPPSPEPGEGRTPSPAEGDTQPPQPNPDPPPLQVERQDPFEELLRKSFAREGKADVLLEVSGNSDIYQEEMKNPAGNVALFGDISLNTVAWAYAPWLQRFRRDFLRNWSAPYAYHLGLIHGHTLVELEISPDGRLLRLDLLEEEGHDSLAQSSVASLRATAPFQALPNDFPEPTLILRVKLIYPGRRP